MNGGREGGGLEKEGGKKGERGHCDIPGPSSSAADRGVWALGCAHLGLPPCRDLSMITSPALETSSWLSVQSSYKRQPVLDMSGWRRVRCSRGVGWS